MSAPVALRLVLRCHSIYSFPAFPMDPQNTLNGWVMARLSIVALTLGRSVVLNPPGDGDLGMALSSSMKAHAWACTCVGAPQVMRCTWPIQWYTGVACKMWFSSRGCSIWTLSMSCSSCALTAPRVARKPEYRESGLAKRHDLHARVPVYAVVCLQLHSIAARDRQAMHVSVRLSPGKCLPNDGYRMSHFHLVL